MPSTPCSRLSAATLLIISVFVAPTNTALAATANDDAYTGFEDSPLVAGEGPILSVDFDTQGGDQPTLDGDWDFLDRIENAEGNNDTYPTDGMGRNWKDADFDITTSTISPWSSGATPLQSGAIAAWPGAPDALFGIAAAPSGLNLITTYLFRNTMTLTAAEAANANWIIDLISDDGSIVYINSVDVFRLNMTPGDYNPAGPVTTNTQTNLSSGNGGSTGSEDVYTNSPLDLSGILNSGVNTIAVEVHQNDLSSSDVGFDLSLTPAGTSATDAFVYADDVFGSAQPGFASGDHVASGGFDGSGGLHVRVGAGQGGGVEASGAWQRSFALAQAATVTVDFRYRMVMSSEFEPNEYGEIIMDIDGSRHGSDQNNSLVHRSSDGGGGPNIDTGWQSASFDIPLAAGDHTISLGLLNFGSTVGNEIIDGWFDDVEIAFLGSAGAAGGSVLKNDDGTGLAAVLDAGPDHGTLALDPDGTFTYTPEPDFSGIDSFTYHANDGVEDSNIATVTITVQAVNDPPVANDDGTFTTSEDTPLSVIAANGLLQNDTDQEDDTLTAVLESNATHGAVTVNPDGSFQYTPEPNYGGDDSFTYRADDGSTLSGVATVSLTVTPQDDPPVAVDDQYSVVENGSLTTTLSGGGIVVYAENFDTGSAPGFEGVIDLEPVQGFAGIGSDGNTFGGLLLRNATSLAGQTAQATSLSVAGLPPHTSIDIRFLLAIIDSWDGQTGGQSPDLFGVRLDGDLVFFETFDNQVGGNDPSYNPPEGGQIADQLDLGFDTSNFSRDSAFDMGIEAALSNLPHTASSVTISWFAAGAGWSGNDESWGIDNVEIAVGNSAISSSNPVLLGSVWKYLDDGSDQGTAWRLPQFDDSAWEQGPAQLGYGDGDETTVVGYGPDEFDKFRTTYFRRKFQVTNVAGVTALTLGLMRDDSAAVYLNGVEVARDNLAADAAFDAFAFGSISQLDETNFFEHDVDPALLIEGENTFAVEIHQADLSSSDISFDLYLSARIGAASSDSAGVLANDFHPDGLPFTASLVSDPAQGDLNFSADGTFTYTPEPNFRGDVAFVYEVTDGVLTAQGTANITVVRGPNAIPVAVPDAYAAIEDEPLIVMIGSGLLVNDTDDENDPLTATVVNEPQNGTLSIAPDGGFTYAPDPNFHGVDTFSYTAFDTFDSSLPALVTITVAPRNDPPVADDDFYIVDPGQPITGNVLANDSDVDMDSITAQLESGPASGSLDLDPDGWFEFTPTAAFTGTVTFSYRAADASATSPPTTVTIYLNAAPVAVADSYSIQEDSALDLNASLGILGNDTDAEDDPLTPMIDIDVSNGTLSLNPDGSLTYLPQPNFFGADSFTYHLSDGLRDSPPATVTIEVQAVNDPPAAQDDRYFTVIGTIATIPAETGVLANDTDIDSSNLTAILVDDVASGTLTLQENGAFTYQPANGFEGIEPFTYKVSDGELESETVTVSIEVGVAAGSIAISEIMSHPASENDSEEFIELSNIGSSPIHLLGWQFTNGIDFTFPDVSINPGEYFVVAADSAAFEAAYGAIPNLAGNWTGRLSNSGERVQLFDAAGNESDDVDYSDQGDWARRRPQQQGGEDGWIWVASHDGGGDSIQVINPLMPNKTGQNWAAAAPTPGSVNSVAATDIAPLIRNVKHRPAVPRPGEPVTVTAELKNESDAGLSATVYYRLSARNPDAFLGVPMRADGGGKFSATLPAQADGAVVEFYLASSDGTNTRTWPPSTDGAGTQGANLLYQVDDESYAGKQPVYRLILPVGEEIDFRPRNYNSGSNAQKNATFIVRQGTDFDVRYRCGLRVRGAGSRGRLPRNWRVNVPRDEPWQGSTRMNLNTQFSWLQTIGMKLHRASDIAAPDAIPVQVRLNGVDHSSDDQDSKLYGSYVHLEPLGGEFAKHQFPDDSDGNHYKKRRPDARWAVRSEADSSPDINAYLGDGWSKGSNSSANDWSDLHQLLKVMNSASGETYFDQVDAVVNIDQWTRWFAVMAFLNNSETNLSNGHDDDYSMYRGMNDPRFVLIPHDLDTIFGLGDTGSNPNATIFQAIEN
ncbi:MAG: VCBS repeat-containing protein, partial [Verrucomicrobiales bacterium]